MNPVPEPLSSLLRSLSPSVLAFSGGSDSSYLLYACRESQVKVRPVFVKGAFQTERELNRAREFCSSLGIPLEIIHVDVLSDPAIAANTESRCYLCKSKVFRMLLDTADGIVIDGTNASDDFTKRPGMRALDELGIRSPLRECGLSKKDVSNLSKIAGLPTWNLPSDSCLATRIPTGMTITPDLLERTEKAEAEIREMGFSGFRVRTVGSGARLETVPSQSGLLESKKDEIVEILLKYYDSVAFAERSG